MPKTTSAIRIRVSEQVVKFKPGGAPACFDVTIVNQSNSFASFQLELEAHGSDPNLGTDWYTLSPEVSTKKPPGDRTQFQVAIRDTPVPGFVGTMNLTVRVSSLELRQEERQILRLILEPGKGSTPLRIDLPARTFQGQPRDLIEIPVHLYNPGQLPADVVLQLTGIQPTWLVEGAERRFRVLPGSRTETSFLCQLPAPTEALSRIYPLTITATQTNGPSSRAEGAIEIVPSGFVEFLCEVPQQKLPETQDWLPNWTANTVTYPLQFENESNLHQQVTVDVREGEDQPHCDLQILPERVDLPSGETAQLDLVVKKNRRWFGRSQKYWFEVSALISDPRLDVRNDTQLLKLRMQPIVPFWLQLLSGAGLLWLLLALILGWGGHSSAVNSVQLDGNADYIVSGSDDQSLMRWRVAGFLNPLVRRNIGTIGKAEKAIRVIRYRPVNNDMVAAGLENGEIQLWHTAGHTKDPVQTFAYQNDDRVLDLAFTRDSRQLFSSHGSGLVLGWNLDRDPIDPQAKVRQPKVQKQLDFAAYAMTPVGVGNVLAIGGRLNRLVLWDWQKNKLQAIPYRAGSQEDYILSLATSDYYPNRLAISDNRGTITLLDTQRCLQNNNCQPIDQWQGSATGKPIHAVAFSPNGCYLTSVGDEGKVQLWALSRTEGRLPEFTNGKDVASVGAALRSVSMSQVGDKLIIATGSADSQVRLHRIQSFNSRCE
jgi:hypothetical protein